MADAALSPDQEKAYQAYVASHQAQQAQLNPDQEKAYQSYLASHGSPAPAKAPGAPYMPLAYPDRAGTLPGAAYRAGEPLNASNSVPNSPEDQAQRLKQTAALGIGAAAGPIASAVGAGGLAATGIDALAGGVAGAVQAPEGHRVAGFFTGATMAGTISGSLRAAPLISQKVGQWLSGLPEEEAAAYVHDPAKADMLYKMQKTQPLEFQRRAQDAGADAMQNLQQGYIDPRKAQVSLAGTGKSYRVNPDQFQGTAAQPHLEDAWAKQGQTMDVPTGRLESLLVQPEEVTPTQSYGPPGEASGAGQTQPKTISNPSLPTGPGGVNRGRLMQMQPQVDTSNLHIANQAGYNPYDSSPLPTASTQEVTPGVRYDPAGFPQEHATFVSGPTQQVPAPMPKSMVLTLPQLLGAKRAASEASEIAYRANPAALTPADTAAAQANSAAAQNLGEALKSHPGGTADILAAHPELATAASKAPSVEDAYNQLHEALRMKEAYERTGNASRMYAEGNTPNNVPFRALREYLDTNAGTNFGDEANKIAAARGLSNPINPLVGKAGLSDPARALGGKLLLKGASLLQPGEGMVSPASQGAALLRDLLYGNSSNNATNK